jgi:uncharacterized repeat protein (TIGR01451 family)
MANEHIRGIRFYECVNLFLVLVSVVMLTPGEGIAAGIEVIPEPATQRIVYQTRSPFEVEKTDFRRAGGPDKLLPRAAEKSAIAGCGWMPGFEIGDLDGGVADMVVYDDGSGPAIYAAGSFLAAGGVTVNRIARWDGAAWSALSGPSGIGVDDSVGALAVYDDGSGEALYAGGYFTTAGGVTVNRIAKWNGAAWSALPGISEPGVDGLEVHALAVYDDGSGKALYAAGSFTKAGGVTAYHVARWDGTSWSPLSGPSGNGLSGRAYALAVYDDGSGETLYAGGNFWEAGGVTVNLIAKWDGTTWSPLSGPSGTGVSNSVLAMAVYDYGSGKALYVGGYFSSAGGVTVNHVARWDGTAWSHLSGPYYVGVSGGWGVFALAVFDSGGGEALFAGGDFTTAGGLAANSMARWDGTAWGSLSGPSGNGVDGGRVGALMVFDEGSGAALFAGGAFGVAGGVPANHIARWDGITWSALSGPSGAGLDNTVNTLLVDDVGAVEVLYAGGYFATAGGVAVSHIARWDGTYWATLDGPSGTGTDGRVWALEKYDDGGGEALYAGGSFIKAGGVTANGIAKWDGMAWSALSGPSGNGTSGWVKALAVFDDGNGPALYAGGDFISAGGVTVNNIAKWDGMAWSALSWTYGTGVGGGYSPVRALAVYDDGGGEALYVGGYFTTAGGVMVNYIASWDGVVWSTLSGPLDTGTNNMVEALVVYDDGGGEALYAAGYFHQAGGVYTGRTAKWDGTEWSGLPNIAPYGYVMSLGVFDDALYAGGEFVYASFGVTVNNIARWDGTEWSPLYGPSDRGVDQYVNTLAVYDDGSGEALYSGGGFHTAGGVPSSRIAKWHCSAADCGDAPHPYPTLVANNGAWHTIVPGFHLGAEVDSELDGQPDTTASGDDEDGNDDDDGVRFTGLLVPGQTATVEVNSSADGLLDAWIDFNIDGDWDDPEEKIFNRENIPAGRNVMEFVVPFDALEQVTTFTRFRFSGEGVAGPTGSALDGEVEDYQVQVVRAVDLEVTKVESVDPVIAGSGTGNLTYTVTATNNGPSVATGIVISEEMELPVGVAIELVTPSGTTTYDGTNTWTVGNLAATESETLVVKLTVDASTAPGTDIITNTVTVTAVNEIDLDSSNDTVTESTSVATAASPIPTLEKTTLLLLAMIIAASGVTFLASRQIKH